MLCEPERKLVEALESGALPAGGFPHREHVRAAWAMLRRDGVETALPGFAAALKRFARQNGAPDLYHETVTWAFVFAIHERMTRLGGDHRWADFAAAYPRLLADGRGFLADHYTAERLDSRLAREQFVLPDRAGAAGSERGERP